MNAEQTKMAEYAVVGWILAGGWEEVVAAGIVEPEQLFLPETREVFRVAKEHGGDAAAVYTAFAGRQLDGRDADEVMMDMEDAHVSPPISEGYARQVLKEWRRRGSIQAHTGLAKALASDDAEQAAYWQGKLVEYEADAGGGGLALVSDADLAVLDVPPPVPVVEGLLDVGEVGLLTAPAKAGKSWFLLQMAKCVAAGVPFLGKSTRQGPVVYINAEVGADAWKRRSDAVTQALGIPPTPTLLHASTRGQRNVTLTTLPVVLRKELARKRLEQVALVVVDPFYALVDEKMDENNAADVKAVMFEFQRLAVELGAAVVVAHHTGKGDVGAKSANDRARGSSAFAGSPDAFITLTPTGAPEEQRWKLDGRRRNGISPEPRMLQFEYPLWRDIGPATEETGGRAGAPRKYTVTTVVEAFVHDGEVLSKGDIMTRTGMSEATFRRLVADIMQQPKAVLEKMPDGRYRIAGGGDEDF